AQAEAQARVQPEGEAGTAGDRIALLAAAARACRARADQQELAAAAEPGPAAAPREGAGAPEPELLTAAVARELAEASASLPERQREALALRELLRLSYEQIGTVMGIEPAAVAPLLARARLRLRAERRGGEADVGPACYERDRALRLLASRQDSEPLS